MANIHSGTCVVTTCVFCTMRKLRLYGIYFSNDYTFVVGFGFLVLSFILLFLRICFSAKQVLKKTVTLFDVLKQSLGSNLSRRLGLRSHLKLKIYRIKSRGTKRMIGYFICNDAFNTLKTLNPSPENTKKR